MLLSCGAELNAPVLCVGDADLALQPGEVRGGCRADSWVVPTVWAFAGIVSWWPHVVPLSGWEVVVGSTAHIKMLGMKIRAITSPSCRPSQAVNSGCCERSVMTRHHLKHCFLCSTPYS